MNTQARSIPWVSSNDDAGRGNDELPVLVVLVLVLLLSGDRYIGDRMMQTSNRSTDSGDNIE